MSYRPPYPHARLLCGFILGNIMLTALQYLVLRPGFLAGGMMPFVPRTLAALSAVAALAAIAAALPLLLTRAEREQQGVGRAMVLIGLFSLPQTVYPYRQALYTGFAPPLLAEMLIVLAVKMVVFAQLAYTLLPRPEPTFEDRRDWRARRYPYWRVVFGCTVAGAVCCHLLLPLADGANPFTAYRFMNRSAQLAVPWLACALWFAAWRLRRTAGGIAQAAAVAGVCAACHFRLDQSLLNAAAASVVSAALCFTTTALILALLLLPPDPFDPPGFAACGTMLVLGILGGAAGVALGCYLFFL